MVHAWITYYNLQVTDKLSFSWSDVCVEAGVQGVQQAGY